PYGLTDVVFYTYYPPEGATLAQLKARINAGIGSVNYRGHGQITYWQWALGWNAGDIYGLTNTFYPIVFNVACLNGTHNLSYNCLSESWMAAPGVGASGNLGASSSSYTTPNDHFDRNLYWALYKDGVTHVGMAVDVSRVAMINAYPGYGLTNARMYHWFGDPAQDVFNCDGTGTPLGLSIAGPSATGPGPQSLTFTVTSGGSAVSGVTVTASDGIGDHPADPENFYTQGTTNSGGQVTLTVDSVEGDTIWVGAWRHNYAYDIMQVTVGSSGTGEGDTDQPPGLTMLPPAPNPASSAVRIEVGLGSESGLELRLYDLQGRIVSRADEGVLQPGAYSFELDLAGVPAGVYLLSATGCQESESHKILIIGR
ncbi:T9SS type A sorting domain-containing protein, partial [Candidatus Fermentibacterales bacterium]|nr:T9SS type A sorting domain-containing protein [Candidatus Fermentibacterales bacterium]